MNFSQLKQQVIDAYPSFEWRKKVEAMSNKRIYAIWNSLNDRGMLPEPKKSSNEYPIYIGE